MLEVNFSKANIARVAQIAVVIALSKCSFHARSSRVGCSELSSLLAAPRSLDGLVFFPWPNTQRPRATFCLGTLTLPQTAPTVIGMKSYHHHVVPVSIAGTIPEATTLSFRTDGLLAIPIEGKLGDRDPSGNVGLPSGITNDWSNHTYIVLFFTCHQYPAIDVADVEVMLAWQQLFCGKLRLDGCRQFAISGGCGSCGNMRYQVGCVVVIGFCQVNLVTNPTGVTFGFVAGIRVIGRTDDLG